MGEDTEKPFDPEVLRGITDIVKNRTLFFIPFFGAYLAFLFGKTDYIRGATPVVWLLLAAIFCMSVRYIYLVTDLLWAVEGIRMVFVFRKAGIEPWKDKEKDVAAVIEVFKLIPRMMEAEHWWFRKTMFLFYVASFIVLFDLFFGKIVHDFVLSVLNHLSK
jgi:hypothetical protein